jgi:hypothetical protein
LAPRLMHTKEPQQTAFDHCKPRVRLGKFAAELNRQALESVQTAAVFGNLLGAPILRPR